MNGRPGYALDKTPAPGEVDLSNWQDAPWNAWGFGHVNELVPTAVIRRVHAADTVGATPLDWVDPDRLEEYIDLTHTRSIVVLADGRLVGEWYGEGMSVSARHTLMSVSKSLCGLLYGRLVDQGLVEEDTRIGAIVPALQDSAFGGATIGQALDMQVSVDYDESYHDPTAHVAQQDRVAGWRPRHSDDPPDTYAFLTGLRAAGPHGQRLQYCSATTDALAWVVEAVTGARYHEVLSAELWSQIAPESDALITVDQGGFAFANGGVACTTRDLARVGQLMLDSGAVGDRQVVPRAWVDATLAGGRVDAAAGTAFQSVHPGGSYARQWWSTGDAHGVVYGAGIHGQYLWVDPASRVVVAKFAAQPDAVSLGALQCNSDFLRWLVDGWRHLTA